jgi:hypothetical protein
MKTLFIILFILMFDPIGIAQSHSSDDQKELRITKGINAENQNFSVSRIYPNPVRDFVNVELNLVNEAYVQTSLYNIAGTEVKKWDSNYFSKGEQKLKLDLSFLKTGIYFLKISSSDRVITQVVKKN